LSSAVYLNYSTLQDSTSPQFGLGGALRFPSALVSTGWSKKANTRETVWVSAFLDHLVCIFICFLYIYRCVVNKNLHLLPDLVSRGPSYAS